MYLISLIHQLRVKYSTGEGDQKNKNIDLQKVTTLQGTNILTCKYVVE